MALLRHELDSARARLRDLFAGAPLPCVIVSDVAVVQDANAAACELLGVSSCLLIGHPVVAHVAQADRSALRSFLRRCLLGGAPPIELQLKRRLGARVAIHGQPTVGREVFLALVDTRTRPARDTALGRVVGKAEMAAAVDAAKDQFLAVLSHELRRPLTPVLAAASALARQARHREPALAQLVALVRRNVGYEVGLIDDLLDATRLAHGKLAFEMATVDLHAIVREAVEGLRPDAEAKGVRVSVRLRARRHAVAGDRLRLVQVFSNLVHNAIKFSRPGQRVQVTSHRRGGGVVVAVRDAGKGIPSTDLSRIFDRFAQGASAAGVGGLGLGLAIAHEIVKAHAGRISAVSGGDGQGARFEVELACVAGPAVARPARPVARPSAIARARRILLVEDHADTGVVLRELLEHEGHTVTLAGTVAEALAHAEAHDLVVSDIGLPDGSGFDLMRQLRARRPGLPGIALSGYGSRDDVRRSRAAGFARHLTKPIELERLLEAIAALAAPARGQMRSRISRKISRSRSAA